MIPIGYSLMALLIALRLLMRTGAPRADGSH